MAARSRALVTNATRWEVDDYLSYLLARASHVVATEIHREVRAAGLTVLEWRALATLSDGRARSVGELASIALAQQSTMTKLLGRMEVDGRIARSDGEADRRQSLVRITRGGRAALGTLLARSKHHERTAVSQLGAREAASLKSALKKLIDADTIMLKRRSGAPLGVLRGMLGRPARTLTVEEMDLGVAAHLGDKHRPRARRK